MKEKNKNRQVGRPDDTMNASPPNPLSGGEGEFVLWDCLPRAEAWGYKHISPTGFKFFLREPAQMGRKALGTPACQCVSQDDGRRVRMTHHLGLTFLC